ncbi:MAG TPA: glycoside hydrolase family 15 protein [Verrucomicrobiae bacterium]|nr:glycoside hydrolase family 15 protein [Verrucomicrobiae bacterium]
MKEKEIKTERPPLSLAYPAIERHGIIGDRRTAALVSADGTLDWLCLPDYDSDIVFGALLDWSKGGYWRLGPAEVMQGEQSYDGETMVLQTEWKLETGTLVLQDAMLWPEDRRAPEKEASRVVVRCLKCVRGTARFAFHLQPGFNLEKSPKITFTERPGGISIQANQSALHLWSNFPLQKQTRSLRGEMELTEGQEIWAVLERGASGQEWSVDAAHDAVETNRTYWREWLKRIHHAPREIRRSAMTVHLLSYAPEGSVVAAATTSLPERIGGDWNADYRLCWVRDTSLALGTLERLGDWEETERYLQWLHRQVSRFGPPLRPLYGIRGEKRPRQKELKHAAGYRNSAPVRIRNHAYKQFQLGSLGFFADCVWFYLQEGGRWQDDYWQIIRRVADFTSKHWMEPDNGIWELPERQHFVSSRVLSWVALDRAVRIAEKVKPDFDVSAWRAELPKIHDEVMERGWSEKLGAFRQRYEADNLDSALLLISVFDFLPPEHPRVLATIERIEERLTLDGYTYRFDPRELAMLGDFPLGELEAAFLPCTFWLATAHAKASRVKKAEAILRRVEQLAGKLGLFAEAVDPRTQGFMGNTPLLFSHAEYVRARMEVEYARRSKRGNRRPRTSLFAKTS